MDIDLVQRCTIKRPLVTARVSQSLNLDCMGSSEFEFGATRHSLIALYTTAGQLRRVNCSGIKDTGGRVLRCYSAFQGFSPDEYAVGLEDIIAGRKHCREYTGLGLACGSKGESSIIRTSGQPRDVFLRQDLRQPLAGSAAGVLAVHEAASNLSRRRSEFEGGRRANPVGSRPACLVRLQAFWLY